MAINTAAEILAATQKLPVLVHLTKMDRERADFEADLTARIQHGIEHGDVPVQASAPGLAKFYSTVLSGMSMQARHAATHEMLIAICEAAMQAWPATVAR